MSATFHNIKKLEIEIKEIEFNQANGFYMKGISWKQFRIDM